LIGTDLDFSEQPNHYGKSLFNGIDIKIGDKYYSVGNRFMEPQYGLTISKGQTSNFEIIENKKPVPFPSTLLGQLIKSIDFYWMKIPFNGAIGYYPQEIEIVTENNYLLISSIEVNNGEVNTECTEELLLIEDIEKVKRLRLGRFGFDNGREYFKTFQELFEADRKNWL
jgi:hypothetical protein